jgi:LmbE family N-acetylglucosaminyl deacetylase
MTTRRFPLLVLTVTCAALTVRAGTAQLAQDAGAAGAWQKLLKTRTLASAMHTTAHPDDEHGGLLAMLSRGQGVRLSLLTLNRGESGDNAIGSELFVGLGLIRTEELREAGKYYGLDRQYFSTMIDYGFSKRLEETIERWGRDPLLRDMVRVIRSERPLVLISRFQGNIRDGHGNHQAAGLYTQLAYKAAADPNMFADQIKEGLRPWQVQKLYIGGVRDNEDWTIRVDTGVYDPVLGESYNTIARRGLSFQRSQNSGRFSGEPGPSLGYYKRLDSVVTAPAKETSFFDGIDTTIPGLYRALRKPAPAGANTLLTAIDAELKGAIDAFTMIDPAASAPPLARALTAVRAARTKLGTDPDVDYVLGIKEEQVQDALTSALGIAFTVVARPAGVEEPRGPFGGGPVPMPPVVPGQTFTVKAQFTNRSGVPVTVNRLALEGRGNWNVPPRATPTAAASNTPVAHDFSVTVPDNAPLTRPYFRRASVNDSRYEIVDSAHLFQPAAHPALSGVAVYDVAGVPVEVRVPVTRYDANLPYGYDVKELAVLPAIAITVSPQTAVTPLALATKQIRVRAEVTNNNATPVKGTVRLQVPAGWRVEPASQPFAFSSAGERAFYPFTVSIPSIENREYTIEAVASAGGHDYREGYDVIRHRDLETRYLYRDSTIAVRGLDVAIAPGLKVGYVMGVGDDNPAAIAQLGVEVTMLGERELASADLSTFDAIMTGTRAYAVREDLRTYNHRLLEYVKNGGNLIVLYNTQEFVPNQQAPFPASLPRGAEEVSEENSPVEILAPAHRAFNVPNTITPEDFNGWIEQRGSKFWTTWDKAYTPMIATWDQGQAKQAGGWLHARYGKGHYTYFAYAFHRQLPYGVPGAYRLLANLLSLGK